MAVGIEVQNHDTCVVTVLNLEFGNVFPSKAPSADDDICPSATFWGRVGGRGEFLLLLHGAHYRSASSFPKCSAFRERGNG